MSARDTQEWQFAHLRFPVPLMARIRRAARANGQSIIDFIRMTLQHALDERDAITPKKKKDDEKTERSHAPGGMFPRQEDDDSDLKAPPESPPSTTVVVMNSGGNQVSDIPALAAYVVDGPNWSRKERLREAVKILRNKVPIVELEKHGELLDQEIVKLDEKAAAKTTAARTDDGFVIPTLKKLMR